MLALFVLLIFIIFFYFGYALVEVIFLIYMTSQMLENLKVCNILLYSGLNLKLKNVLLI
jgi:hypothetical protein